MSTRLTCPGCHRQLLLPADCTAELLSCPRCLAHIPNPQAGDLSSAVQATPPAYSPAAPSPESLRDPDVDRDVRRDQRGTSVLMIVLAVFGALGLCYILLLFGVAAQQDREFQPLVLTLWVLAAVTALSAAWVFRRPSPTMGANIGRTLLGVLTISGGVLMVGFLLAVALVVFLFAVCLVNGGKC